MKNRIPITLWFLHFAACLLLGHFLASGQNTVTWITNATGLASLAPVTPRQVAVVGNPTAGWQMWHWDAASTESTNRAIVKYGSTSTGRWKQSNNGYIDPRYFGATATTFPPLGWATTSDQFSSIGTNDFSVWIQADFPTTNYLAAIPVGSFIGLGRIQNYTGAVSLGGYGAASTLEVNCNNSIFYVLLRGTDGGSGSASSCLISYPISALSGVSGASDVNVIFTRTGTNIATYLNGSLLTGGTITRGDQFGNAIAGTNPARLEIGHSSSLNYACWPAEVQRGATFARVLSGADLTNPASAATPSVSVTAAYTGAVPADSSTAIQAAIDYASSIGGVYPVRLFGAYRVDTALRMKQFVHLDGDFSTDGPVASTSGQRAQTAVGPSRLFTWFGATNNLLVLDGENDSGSYSEKLINAGEGPNGEFYNTWVWNSRISGITLDQTLSYSGDAIQARFVTEPQFHNIHFAGQKGYMMNMYYVNRPKISGFLGGENTRGVFIYGASDGQVHNMTYGGVAGSGLSIVNSAGFFVADNFIFNAVSPLGGAATADTGTDLVTQASHPFNTGDYVFFTDTPPSPLAVLTPYWAGKVSTDTFGVAASRSNALAGVFINLTTAGSFNAVSGPVANVFDYSNTALQLSQNRLEESYENGVVINYGNDNKYDDNRIWRNGYNNATNTWAGIWMANSTRLAIDGLKTGKRLVSDPNYGVYGVRLDSGNVAPKITSIAGDSPYPVSISASQNATEVSYAYLSNELVGSGQNRLTASGVVAESLGANGSVTLMSRSGTNYPGTTSYRTLGTPQSPTAVTAGTNLRRDRVQGLNSAGTVYTGFERIFYAGEDATGSASGTYYEDWATANGGTNLTLYSALYTGEFDWYKLGRFNSGAAISDLTSGRVTFASTAGRLVDSSSLTFNSGTGRLTATSFAGDGSALTGFGYTYIDAGAMAPFATAGANPATTTLTTNGIPVDEYEFDASSIEKVLFKMALPDGWNGTTLTAKFFWRSTATTGNCVWTIAAMFARDGDNPDITFGTAQEVTDGTSGTANFQNISAATSTIVPSGTYAAGSMVYFIITRDATDVSDTLTVDALLDGIKINWQ